MDWIKATLLLIVVAGWVLSALAKKREPPRGLRAVAPPPRGNDDVSAPPPRRRSASEVDKFLEEVRRRRESLEGRKPQPAPVRPVESRQPAPRRVPEPPPLPRQQPRRTAQPVVVEAVLADIPEVIVLPTTTTDMQTTGATSPGPAGSSVTMRQTLALLNNPESLISAMVLQEIMQRPVSQRRGFVPAHRK